MTQPKYTESDLAKAFVILAAALNESGWKYEVREKLQVVRDKLRLAAAIQGKGIETTDEAFSACYTAIDVEEPRP